MTKKSNREPICGFCWATRQEYVALEWQRGVDMWMCPGCKRMTDASLEELEMLKEPEEKPAPRTGPIPFGGPPIPKRRGRGTKSGRRRAKKPKYEPRPWDI